MASKSELLTEVQPLDLSKLMGRVRNRVAKCGIELEGGWTTLPPHTNVIRDGSVFMNITAEDSLRYRQLKIAKIGEIPSDPMIPGQMSAWIRKYHPHMIDSSCGLHVHMSFDDLKYYNALMVPEFPATMLMYLRKWAENEKLPTKHPIWARLADNSEYCRQIFWPDKQATVKRKDYDHNRDGHRYTAINYCFGTHGTIECRALPMMETAALSISAARQVIDVTNASIVALTKREPKWRETVESPAIEIEEDDIEVI